MSERPTFECRICLGKLPSIHDLIGHMLLWCLPGREDGPGHQDSRRRHCWCGKRFDYRERDREAVAMSLKEHICGRKLPGVLTAPITMQEIIQWPCLNAHLMGVDKE